jgi:hypothetical protein
MPAFRGKDVVVTFGGTDISGDGRSVDFEESADALDSSKWGDTRRTKVAGLEDASGSMEALDTTGAWSAAWDAIAVGTMDELIIQPEGAGSGNRELTAQALITGRSVSWPYDDLATLSMDFEVSGDVTEGAQA